MTQPFLQQPEQTHDFTVAIVEDEPVLRQELAFQLTHLGFVVEAFESSPAFFRFMALRRPTIVVLDIGLPGEDGLSICSYLRQNDGQMGIVFLTARGLRDDRLAGLGVGADAYLVKPVDVDELALILRRLALRLSEPPTTMGKPMTQHAWKMEPGSGFISTPNGKSVRVTVIEGQVLTLLLSKSGLACSHQELATALGLHSDEYSKHRAEVIVSRLRSKVERETGQVLPLESVRGVGYRWVF